MHVYGTPGAHAPALHLRKLGAGDLFDTYARSFVDVSAYLGPGRLVRWRMARTDHHHDPDAPLPTSIVIAVSAFVTDDHDRLLMIRRTDNALYALPGGRHEIGETMTDTAVRETDEETGLRIEVTSLVGIYSNPHHVMVYGDGEVRQEFSICFRGRAVGGELRTSEESSGVRWAERTDLAGIEIHPAIRLRIEHGYDRPHPYYT